MNTQTTKDASRGTTSPEAGNETPDSASAAFGDAAKRIAEVKEYISYFVAVQLDSVKLAARNAIFYAVLGVIGLLAGGTIVIMAVVLLLGGVAEGIGRALGHVWLGNVIVGVVVLGALLLGVKIASSKMIGLSRKKTVEKYESLQKRQRTRFGHDVSEHAADV